MSKSVSSGRHLSSLRQTFDWIKFDFSRQVALTETYSLKILQFPFRPSSLLDSSVLAFYLLSRHRAAA